MATVAATYTLDSLLEVGYKNSHELRSVEEEMQKTDAQLYEYYGKAMPSIDLNANLQHAFDQYSPYSTKTGYSVQELLLSKNVHDTGSMILGGVLDNMASGFSPKDNTANVGLSVKQPLFAQGKVLIGLKIAKLYSRALVCKWLDTKMSVRAAITKTFYTALYAVKTDQIKRNAVVLAEESHRQTVLKFTNGKAAELDTLNSHLFRENALIDFQDAQKNTRNAYYVLTKSAGIEENLDSMRLSGDFPLDTYTISLQNALAALADGNKKIIQMKSSAEIQNLMVKLTKTDFYPIIYCGATVSKITQFNDYAGIKWYDDQKVSVGLTYNIFNGLQRKYKIRQATADAIMFNHAMDLAIKGIQIQTRNAWETMEMNRKRLHQTEGLVTFARKAYDITRKAYDVGTKTLLDLQQSELSYNDALLKNSGARFALHSAVVDLRVLLGEYLWEQ